MAFCLYCKSDVDHVINITPRTFFVRGTKVEYNEVTAHCPFCKRGLYVSEINDQNCINRDKAYKKTVKGEK